MLLKLVERIGFERLQFTINFLFHQHFNLLVPELILYHFKVNLLLLGEFDSVPVYYRMKRKKRIYKE